MIELKGVTKTYRMGDETIRALDDVTFRIDIGEFVAILGPSGSGKSTLMHMIGLMDLPSEGAIFFDGIDVTRLKSAEQADIRGSKIGFVFQAFNLLPRFTVEQNVRLPYAYYRGPPTKEKERTAAALAKVGLSHRRKHRPNQLSGGERQRVAIARALAIDPRIILADEPSGNLDSGNAKKVLELFVELNQSGNTIVIVTHDEKVASYARRQVNVLDGRIFE